MSEPRKSNRPESIKSSNPGDVASGSSTPVLELESLAILDTRKKKKKPYGLKEMQKLMSKEDISSNFMQDFDPSKPRREKQKASKKSYSTAKKPVYVLYNAKGILDKIGKDLCDCLEEECIGCHFPCQRCRSNKCGHECRQLRKWQYEYVETEGEPNSHKSNQYLQSKKQ